MSKTDAILCPGCKIREGLIEGNTATPCTCYFKNPKGAFVVRVEDLDGIGHGELAHIFGELLESRSLPYTKISVSFELEKTNAG